MRRAATALLACLLTAALSPRAVAAPTYTYPPPAPAPTDDAGSPGAPDPRPPAGGIGPKGEIVGGPLLARRGLVLPKGAPALPSGLTAHAWVLVDLDSGAILAARDPHGRYQPASILKLLTAVTLIPRLPGTTTITATKAIQNTEGSHAGLVAKGRYTVDDLFKGLLLVSGNDTAMALAQAAGGVQRTVELMNQTALNLGAYDTYVQTPSGLDGWQQLTSAYDMAVILRAALRLPRFVAYDRVVRAYLPSEPVVGRVELDNQNAYFLQNVRGALVAKTGYTDAARHTYVAAVERGGRRLGVVFLRAERWPLDQWQQAVKLFAWGYALPRGTAPVGHLDPPVSTAAPNALHRAVSAAVTTARVTAKTSRGELVALAAAAFALVLVLGWRVGRVRHRPASRR
jgi:D-alanyl-D-alanine carboxypeptidase (penicillin-binding protein 5/6)